MSGVTGLVDTLLAAKLSQRLDLLGLKSAAAVAGPGPAVGVEPVGNDVRLLSHAALDRQIGIETATDSYAGAKGATGAQLSVAARAISTVLADIQAEAGPVRGVSALWPSLQALPVAVLAGTLANAVSASGMFYESHLLEFAQGLLARPQLAQEPQAGWARPGAGKSAPAPLPDAVAAATAKSGDSAALSAARPTATAGPPVLGVIHPQAVALVHQQLDLLASGVFRWAGEAWPGVPLEWAVQEDPGDRHPRGSGEEAPARWTTALSLVFPRLGAVEVRLNLTGNSVTASLAANDATLVRLQAEAGDLRQRLASAGFSLPELAITSRDRC